MTVTPELHAAILERDGMCFAARLDPDHTCRDKYGDAHAATDVAKLTLDHVHHVAGGVRGKRAPDDERHLVALCWFSNVAGPSRAVREAERAYLNDLYVTSAGADRQSNGSPWAL